MAFGKNASEAAVEKKVLVKRRLLNDRYKGFYEAVLADAVRLGEFNEADIHRIELLEGSSTAVHFTDGSVCEINPTDQKLYLTKEEGHARKFASLAAELFFPWGDRPEAIEVQRRVAAARKGKDSPWTGAPQANEAVNTQASSDASGAGASLGAKSVEERWWARGYRRTWTEDGSVWIRLGGGSTLRDSGNSLELFGRGGRRAISAILDKSAEDWGGALRLEGNDKLVAQCWLEAQRRGIEVVGYEPSASLARRWAREQRISGWLKKTRKETPDLRVFPANSPLPEVRESVSEAELSTETADLSPLSAEDPIEEPAPPSKAPAGKKVAFGTSFSPVNSWYDRKPADEPLGQEVGEPNPAS